MHSGLALLTVCASCPVWVITIVSHVIIVFTYTFRVCFTEIGQFYEFIAVVGIFRRIAMVLMSGRAGVRFCVLAMVTFMVSGIRLVWQW